MSLPPRIHIAVPIVALLVACNGGTTTPPPPPPPPAAVASVSLTGSTSPLVIGQTTQLTATPKDASGNALTGRTVTWGSSVPGVATVSNAGLVTALTPGLSTITATIQTISATASITVTPVPVASVAITSPKSSFFVGEVSQFTAQPKDAQGNALTGRAVTWGSSQSSVATVSLTGLVTAVGVGTAAITATSEGISSPGTMVTVAIAPVLIEQRALAQQGLAIALASTVLQSQLYTLIQLVVSNTDLSCTALPGGGAFKLASSGAVIPTMIGFYFDAACARIYMNETVTLYTADAANNHYRIIANATYTGPTGTPLGSIAFDERADGLAVVSGGTQLVGTVNGLGTYTSLNGAPDVHLGLDCNIGAGGHVIGICQGGIAQNFPGLSAAFGSVTTLALDTLPSGAVTLAGTSLLTSSALSALTLTQPTTTTMVVNGGAVYGNTSDAGGAASFTLFPPTPTGWTVTDATNDQVFTINVADNVVRNLVGTLKRISTGATLATIVLDQSGTGTITYSDNRVVAVTGWMLSQ